MIAVTQRPADIVGALSPVVYKFQRKDFQWTSIDNNGGFVRVTFDSVDLSADFTVDDLVYIKSSSGDFDEFGVVTAVSFSGGDTLVTLDIPYHATADGGTSDDFVNNTTERSLYQLAINLYDNDTDEALIDVPILYTPNSKGYLLVDVQLLKGVLSPEILNIIGYGLSEEDEGKSVDFYIGYTEQWTGSSEGESMDNYFSKTAIFGSMQILGRNDYLTRLPDKFMTRAEKLRLFRGKYFDISYFGMTSSDALFIEHYDGNDDLTSTETVDVTSGIGRAPILPLSTDKKIITRLSEGVFILPGTEWEDNPLTDPLTKSPTTLSASLPVAGSTSNSAIMPAPGIDLSDFADIVITITVSGVWAGSWVVFLSARDDNGDIRSVQTAAITANGVYVLTLTDTSTLSSGSTLFDCITIVVAGSTASGTMLVSIEIPTGQFIYYSSETSSQEIEVADPCKRPVALSWCNEVGGQEWWVFDWNQEHSYVYEDGRKVRRLLLSTEELSLDQWDLVNGLNTIGEVYNRSIPELTADIRGTQKRINGQVYLLLDDLTLLEVIVIPIPATTQSKKIEHQLQVQIELPECFTGNNFSQEFSGETKRFIASLTVDSGNPDAISWRVKWFGSIPIDLITATNNAQEERTFPLPDVPVDITVIVSKISNNGIAQEDGQVTFSKDGAGVLNTVTFLAGDDVSEIIFVVPAVTAVTVFPNDRVNVNIQEHP